MMVDRKLIYGAIGMVALLIGVGFAFMGGGDNPSGSDTSSKSEVRKHQSAKNLRRLPSSAKTKQERRKSAKSIKVEPREKPKMLFLEDEEEKELTDLARKVLASLQAALDAEDFEQIKQIFEMARSAPKGSLGKYTEGMPVALRKKMVDALGWFGAQALPEMVEYLGDDNSDVSQMALDQFVMALSDVSLGDRARAKIVVMASSVLKDPDALGQIFIEISNMRNSEAANTIYSICDSGTPEAKAMMPETIEFITGEEGITTVEGLEEWVKKNPDGADDEDLYGPIKVD
jgi:hypothetical protein